MALHLQCAVNLLLAIHLIAACDCAGAVELSGRGYSAVQLRRERSIDSPGQDAVAVDRPGVLRMALPELRVRPRCGPASSKRRWRLGPTLLRRRLMRRFLLAAPRLILGRALRWRLYLRPNVCRRVTGLMPIVV